MFVRRGSHPVGHISTFGRVVTCNAAIILATSKKQNTKENVNIGVFVCHGSQYESQFEHRTSRNLQSDYNYAKKIMHVFSKQRSISIFVTRTCNLAGALFIFWKCLLRSLHVQDRLRLLSTDSNLQRYAGISMVFENQILVLEFPQSSKKRGWQDYCHPLAVSCVGLVTACQRSRCKHSKMLILFIRYTKISFRERIS